MTQREGIIPQELEAGEIVGVKGSGRDHEVRMSLEGEGVEGVLG
jgi:hypothetical protein